MILAILQARISSSRLPAKVLLPILNKPMLLHQIERINKSKLIDKLVVATSVNAADNDIEFLCNEHNIDCYRGNLNDVLDRFYNAAKQYNPDVVVRLTGDCPLTDYEIIDNIINCHINGKYDYTSNALNPTYADGLDVEIINIDVLNQAYLEAQLPSEREHVTPFIYKNSERFKLFSYENNIDLSNFRWTVDNKEDFIFITKIYENLYEKNPNFKTADILKLIEEQPDLLQLNKHFRRNEGLEQSLLKE